MPSSTLALQSPVHGLAFISLLATAANMAQASPSDMALHLQQKRGLQYAGCYSSSAPMKFANTYEYQTSSYCESHFCSLSNSAVLGLSDGGQCWCGNELPSAASQVDDSSCSTVCNGYKFDKCGAPGFWSVYYTGATNIQNYDGENVDSSTSTSTSSESSSTSTSTSSTSSSTSTSDSATPSVSTSVAADHTVLVTIIPSSSASNTSKNHSSNGSGSGSDTVGIAVGVVVGLVGFAAIIAGVFFFLRHRRRQQVKEEYKRTQITEFFRPTHERKAPGSSYSHTSDSRLEPAGTHRNSVGSLADDQDYSRRILRVANPDGM